MTLDGLEPQRDASIVAVSGDGALAQRLLAMGFLPGAAVRVVQVAPLGDPLTVDLEGWRVSLRRSEARRLEVAPR
ncbi:MAG TPA: ferrous iron transport protein A [Planctomycetota bacterium]|nr:ferrous iron transport protein A [Planctomycetota bacterium]